MLSNTELVFLLLCAIIWACSDYSKFIFLLLVFIGLLIHFLIVEGAGPEGNLSRHKEPTVLTKEVCKDQGGFWFYGKCIQ